MDVKTHVKEVVNLPASTHVTHCVLPAVMTLVLLVVTLDAKRLVTQHVQTLVKDAMADVKKLVQMVVKVVTVDVNLLVQKVVKDVDFVEIGCDDGHKSNKNNRGKLEDEKYLSQSGTNK